MQIPLKPALLLNGFQNKQHFPKVKKTGPYI